MTDKINGRTPEEIKLWVEYMSTTNVAKKIEIMNRGCPYQFNEDIAADALALIQQLERERDAALLNMRDLAARINAGEDIRACEYCSKEFGTTCNCKCLEEFELCGVQDEK